MPAPSKLISYATQEAASDPPESFGLWELLVVVGAFFLSAALVGFFGGLATFVGARTYAAFSILFPGP